MSGLPLAGQRAFVTGATGAIGQAIARRLAADGARLALGYFSDHEGASQLAEELARAPGGAPLLVQANFRYPETIQETLAALRELGGVEIFVSNAASGVLRDATRLSAKHWQWALDVNARAFLLLAQGLLEGDTPLMGQGGRMLAISSLGAQRAIPQYGAVGASKAALEALVRTLALELGSAGIRVNCLSPGIVETRALEFFPNKEQLLALARAKTPLGRLVTPAEVADVAAFLVSDGARMIAGQTIQVDGGYSIVG